TGTTTEFRDNWAVGFTPDLVVGVWAGNPDNSPMQGVSGITGAALIWHDYMEDALKGQPARAFAPPPGLVRPDGCVAPAEAPAPACEERGWDLFRSSELKVPSSEPATPPRGGVAGSELGTLSSELRISEPDRDGIYRLVERLPPAQQALPVRVQ